MCTELKGIDIKGKLYVEVNERVNYFRTEPKYDGWASETEIISLVDGVVIIKATIKDPNGVVKSTGFAYEKEGSTFINKTSYIENAETSAIGRALGFLGIGIKTSIASAEEVLNAQLNQGSEKPKEVKKVSPLEEKNYTCSECGKDISEKVYKYSMDKLGKALCFDCQNKKL